MVAPAGMWTLLASAMRLPISSGGRPPKCEAAIAARTSSSVMASTTGYKPCPDDNAQPIQVHTRKLLQPRMPGKVTKRGPLTGVGEEKRASAFDPPCQDLKDLFAAGGKP